MSQLLHELVRAQTERAPNAVAMLQGRDGVTYAELERRANQIARLLRDHGCRRGDRVVVMSSVTANAVAAVLGILKADAICVTPDQMDPVDLRRLIEDCGPACVLTAAPQAVLLDGLAAAGALASTVVGSLERSSIAGQGFFTLFNMTDAQAVSDRPVASRNRTTNPATLVFKPGGPPRGVVTTHASLARTVSWAVGQFDVKPGDRLDFAQGWAGDRGLFAILTGLAGGATLVPSKQDHTRPRLLVDLLRRDAVTHWYATADQLTAAAAADSVLPADLPRLRHVICWAEVVAAPVFRYWTRRVGHSRFTSVYGAPEAATISAHWTWAERGPASEQPLGQVCPGHDLVVLNDQLEPTVTNEVGDIWIKGMGLSPGYWRNPTATAEEFRGQGLGAGLRDRMWRSGDRGRRASDGSLYLVRATTDHTWQPMPIPDSSSNAVESGSGV